MNETALAQRARRLAKLVGWRIKSRRGYYLLFDDEGAMVGGESFELLLLEALRILLAQ
jgi:hypothetical protein